MPRFAMRSSEELAPGLENMRVLRWVNEDGEPSEEAEITFIPGDIAPGQVAVPPAEPSSSGGASGRLLVSARLSTLRRSQKTSRPPESVCCIRYGWSGGGSQKRGAWDDGREPRSGLERRHQHDSAAGFRPPR